MGVSMALAVGAWAGHAAGGVHGISTRPSSTAVSSPTPSAGSIGTDSLGSTSSTSGTTTSVASTTSASQNWSGLATTGTAERSVGATWTVPSFTQADFASNSAIGEWVGLGGMRSHQLIQVGTLTEPGVNGEAQTVAFWEQLPNAAVDTVAVPTGDAVTATITPAGPDRWRLELTVAGEAAPAVDTVVTLSPTAAAGVETSAEWITEAPTSPSGIMNLAPVASTVMRNVQVNGVPLAKVSNGALEAISMVGRQGATIATPTVSIGNDSVAVATVYDSASGLGSGGTGGLLSGGSGFGVQAPGFGGSGDGYDGYGGYGYGGGAVVVFGA